MKVVHLILAVALLGSAGSPAIMAEGSTWTLRVHGAILDSSSSASISAVNGLDSNLNVGGGAGVAAELRLSERLGLEFSALFAGLELRTRIAANPMTIEFAEMTMMPVTLGLPIHFRSRNRVDLYVVPTIALVNYTGLEATINGTRVASTIHTDSDFGIGASLGMDIPFRSGKWAFSTGLRYLKASAGDKDIDPVIATIGFAYRF